MMTMPMGPSELPARTALLADRVLRERLVRLVRGRVPASEVEDVVQAALTEALAASDAPAEPDQLQRWVLGIARHKCVDFFRRRGREMPAEDAVDSELAGNAEPLSARDFMRWAERELPPGEPAERTFEWMLREASGDKLEHIAEEERIPAPRVRQRVTRMRRHFRERWAAQVAALVAAVTVIAVAVGIYRYHSTVVDRDAPIAKEPPPSGRERGREVRDEALRRCDAEQWRPCLQGLDAAARLDPDGDSAATVTEARARARAALERPVPVPTAPSATPSALAPVPAPSSTWLEPKSSPKPSPMKKKGDLPQKWQMNLPSKSESMSPEAPRTNAPTKVAPPAMTSDPFFDEKVGK